MAGDDDGELFRSLYPSLRAFAAAVGAWDVEPDDLVQEALARTLRRRALSDLDAPGPYLRKAILNLVTSEGRRRASRRAAFTRSAEVAVTIEPVPSDLADLEHLSPLDRAVLYLVHVEGWPHVEVGRLLGITEQASRTRTSRATRQLRAQIEAEEAAS